MITVFYDDDCPICQSEITHLTAKNPDKIIGIPVKNALDELNQAGIDKIEALTYLCIKDDKGHFYKGIEAVRLLHQTANSEFALILDLPIIKPMSELIYPIFAKHRYKIPKWIAHLLFGKPKVHCENGVCHINPKDRINQ
ncbi:thiol-disulfide oxidoreductase DCC family protein [Moraxella oblonga]|uniref:thiol-disulfide oxidoreductase DCC family protein n=1 Tax=Moraxella oblonga TaxID=200413 RepID=UPI0008364DCF|nr:DUF393 domain-containing protein [Moraxella oblonga]